jgi:hypothetical protein
MAQARSTSGTAWGRPPLVSPITHRRLEVHIGPAHAADLTAALACQQSDAVEQAEALAAFLGHPEAEPWLGAVEEFGASRWRRAHPLPGRV